MSDPELVAQAIARNPDTAHARHLLVGDLSREHLDYGDWIAALRWSDGRVCIAIEAWWAEHFESVDADDTRLYFRLIEEDGDELIERAPPDEYGRSTMTRMHFQPTLAHHLDRAKLVLVEDSDLDVDGGEAGV